MSKNQPLCKLLDKVELFNNINVCGANLQMVSYRQAYLMDCVFQNILFVAPRSVSAVGGGIIAPVDVLLASLAQVGGRARRGRVRVAVDVWHGHLQHHCQQRSHGPLIPSSGGLPQ